ncbi:coiled-coil domain-containing protein 169 [Genypterus blacodes]|uniref:coiled-coil domain-containing protein 169 n=1 Tax=Genypterus blacodes TaxID=154954 RepID=UPI003F77256E
MSADPDYSKHDATGLQGEVEQEREMKEMLEESVSDLRGTMSELQHRLQGVDGEENEWKTRYETQTDLNGQLERQVSIIHERLEDWRGNPVDRLASIRSYDDMTVDSLRQRLKLLTEEKTDLQAQLMDSRLRLEQEGKAFHKTNDERRAYLAEIAKLSSTLEANRRQYSIQPHRAPESKQRRGKQTSRKTEADFMKGERRGEDGGVRGEGGGGGGVKAGRREEKKAVRGSRLPTLKHHVKHNA